MLAQTCVDARGKHMIHYRTQPHKCMSCASPLPLYSRHPTPSSGLGRASTCIFHLKIILARTHGWLSGGEGCSMDGLVEVKGARWMA
jgi:hypothetical protein